MARVIAGMTVSLDGFVQDANGSTDALYPDLTELQDSAYMKALQERTGAVLMGRRTFDMAGDPDGYADSYELQVPIFVLTHTPPAVAPKHNERLFLTVVTDGSVSTTSAHGPACGSGCCGRAEPARQSRAQKRSRTAAARCGSSTIHQCPRPSSTSTRAPARAAARCRWASVPTKKSSDGSSAIPGRAAAASSDRPASAMAGWAAER